MGNVAFTVGTGVVALTAGSRAGLLGGHDFLLVAVVGLVAGTFCVVTALATNSQRAAVGAAMSTLPVVLLVYYLMTGEG